MRNKLITIVLLFLLIPLTPLSAQNEEEQKIRDIISFLEYMLNTLGDPQTSARDKDVIVNESYAKIFRDGTVQVEDDLDENRDVITNKDVQAYLKDVNFFFRKAHFNLEWQDMEVSENQSGETFYKVTLLRNLEAVSVMGDTINQTLKRYVEINLNPEAQDLRIASIYTNELNQDDVWMDWWQNLSLEWQAIFKRQAGSIEDLRLEEIKKLEKIEELDLQGNGFIVDIQPLSRITALRRLNLANTKITDISPIRNLNKLEFLDISHTGVSSIDPLTYSRGLRVFHIDHTPVQDISVISRMPALEVLTMNGTFTTDFSPISGLKSLKTLDCSYTEMNEFSILRDLSALTTLRINGTDLYSATDLSEISSLQELYADSTYLSTLAPLANLENLKVLSVNNTSVNDLQSLANLKKLEKVYCDYTQVTLNEALTFMQENPQVLVIFESEDLISWWDELPVEWQEIFNTYVKVGASAEKEELASIVRIDSLNVKDNLYIQDLEPLKRLVNLRYLNISGTAVKSLDPVVNSRDLQIADVSSSGIRDITPLSDLINLKEINASSTVVDSLGLVRALPNLVKLDIDNTNISDDAIITMARMRPETLIIYKSERLKTWWDQLSQTWQDIFRESSGISGSPDREELHRLISSRKLIISDRNIYDIHPLKEFIRLNELKVSGTSLRNISPISFLEGLEKLDISRNPLEDITALKSVTTLKELNISNTPITDLDILSSMYRLVYLDCSGTQIKGLDGLERLGMLETLDCSNTAVKKLDPVEKLSLKTLKCYNTRISSKRIDSFKQLNPDCDVSFY